MALPLLALSACAPTQNAQDAARIKSLALALTGTYDGAGKAGLLKNSYRLLLNIDPRTGRADAVLTNTSVNKVYPASGTFTPYDDKGGNLDLTLFDGKREAGHFTGRVQAGTEGNAQLSGNLKTLLLNFQLDLSKQLNPQPIPRFLPDLPPNYSQLPASRLPAPPSATASVVGTVETSPAPVSPAPVTTVETTVTETTQPVYVTPTPGPLPK